MNKEIPPLVDDDENYLKIFNSKDPFAPFMVLCAIAVAALLYGNVRSKKGETPKKPPVAEVQKKSK